MTSTRTLVSSGITSSTVAIETTLSGIKKRQIIPSPIEGADYVDSVATEVINNESNNENDQSAKVNKFDTRKKFAMERHRQENSERKVKLGSKTRGNNNMIAGVSEKTFASAGVQCSLIIVSDLTNQHLLKKPLSNSSRENRKFDQNSISENQNPDQQSIRENLMSDHSMLFSSWGTIDHSSSELSPHSDAPPLPDPRPQHEKSTSMQTAPSPKKKVDMW